MDKMLVRYILVILGVAIRSNSLSISTDLSSSKNSTSDSFLDFKPRKAAKPKRQLDNFDDFDVGSFEGSSFFKTEDTTSLENLDTEDFSGFLPTGSKVTRSNIHDLGTYGAANFDSSSLSSENYQTDSEVTEKNPDAQNDYYSNEDQSALSQSQLNTVNNNNQGTTPHYNNVSNQPKFIPLKPSPFLTEQKNLPVIQYNTYSPSLAEYASGNPTYTPSNQLPIQNISPTHSITYAIPYKTQYSHPSRTYAPLHNHNQQQQSYGVPYQNAFNNVHLTTAPTAVDVNGKKLTLPILQLQTQVPNYVQALKNSPIIFGAESGLQYKTQPGLGVSFDFAKPKNHNQRLGTNAPFVVTHNPRTTQLLPLKTSSSTAQFPQYKGASVSQFPNRGFQVIPNDYQEFKLQPQLHFSKNTNNKNNAYRGLKNYQKAAGVYSNPSAQIKSDVEIIDKKKKKPPPPSRNDDDDDDDDEKDKDNSDEDYAGKDSYAPKEEDEDKSSRKRFKEPELKSDFVPSKSYPFKEYDQKFGKPKKSSFNSDDDNDDDDHDDESNLATKYRYSTKSDDDEDDDDDSASKYENESLDDESKSNHHSRPIYDSYKNHYDDENDDDEEQGIDIKDKKNYLKRLERNNHGKKSRRSQKERGTNNQGKYGRLHGDKYHQSTEFDVSHSKSRPNQRRPIDSMKPKHRAYRDESGEPSTRQISTSFLQNNANNNAWPTENINVLSQIKNSNIEVPKTTWKNSYGTRLNVPDDDSNRSIYSQEAAAMYKHPRSPVTTTQEYTTRPAHKTSTILSKGLANSNSSKTTESSLRPRSAWNKEEKQKFNSSTDNRSFSTGVKGLVHPTEKNFNFGFHYKK